MKYEIIVGDEIKVPKCGEYWRFISSDRLYMRINTGDASKIFSVFLNGDNVGTIVHHNRDTMKGVLILKLVEPITFQIVR